MEEQINILKAAFELMRMECLKHTTYSACEICPFGALCKKGIGNVNDEDVEYMINKYEKSI